MPNIKITVAGKIATNTTPGVVIVCGNSDYTVTFDLDAEWAAEAKRTARFVFYRDGLRLYKDVEFTGNTATAPVLSGIDYVEVGVYAGDLRTTTPARVLCDRSILCGDPMAVPPTTAEQLQAQIGALEAAVNELATKPTGITAAEKALILELFRNAAYTSADMAGTLTQLENLWGGGGENPEPDIPDVPGHTHSYTSAITKAATCETAGVRTFTCSCGHSYTQSIPATGHNYVNGVCTVCGAADPDYEGDEPTIEGEQIATFSADIGYEEFYAGNDEGSASVFGTSVLASNIYSTRRTETDANVSVVFTNNTGSAISFGAAIGGKDTVTDTNVLYGATTRQSFYHSVLVARMDDPVTLAAGESMVVPYTLRAGHHLHAYASNKDITITAFGTLDILEFASTIPMTANGSLVPVYKDDGVTSLANPGGATKYQTAVFENDTTVRVTFYADVETSLHGARNFICCYSSGNAGHYGVQMPGAKLRAGVPWTTEYTVKAGYCLASCTEPQYIYVEEV